MADIRLPGLATGLDTSSIIEQLMAIERRPKQMIQLAKNKASSRIDALRRLNTKFLALEMSAKSVMGTSFNLSSFTAKKATSSDTNVFTVTAGNTTNTGTWTVDNVTTAKSQHVGNGAFNALHGGGTLRINGTAGIADIAINPGDTAQSIANQINANANSSMVASVASGNLVLEGKIAGAGNDSTISILAGPMSLADMGLAPAPTDIASSNMSVRIQGATYTNTSNSNTFTDLMPGLSVTAVSDFTGAPPKTMTVSKDASVSVGDLKDLIAKYNDIVTTVKDLTKYDKDTKQAGVLTGDSFVTNLLPQLNRMLTDVFDTNSGGNAGLVNSTTIGISVQRDGTISLDESKFNAALTANPNEVYNLLSREDGVMSAPTVKGNNAGSAGVQGDGLANRLRAFANAMISSNSDYNTVNGAGGRYEGSLLNRINTGTSQLGDYDKRILAFEDRLANRERLLRQQFQAMEKSVSLLRSQGNYLSGQFSQQ